MINVMDLLAPTHISGMYYSRETAGKPTDGFVLALFQSPTSSHSTTTTSQKKKAYYLLLPHSSSSLVHYTKVVVPGGLHSSAPHKQTGSAEPVEPFSGTTYTQLPRLWFLCTIQYAPPLSFPLQLFLHLTPPKTNPLSAFRTE